MKIIKIISIGFLLLFGTIITRAQEDSDARVTTLQFYNNTGEDIFVAIYLVKEFETKRTAILLIGPHFFRRVRQAENIGVLHLQRLEKGFRHEFRIALTGDFFYNQRQQCIIGVGIFEMLVGLRTLNLPGMGYYILQHIRIGQVLMLIPSGPVHKMNIIEQPTAVSQQVLDRQTLVWKAIQIFRNFIMYVQLAILP